jgi:hypothetical protein
VEEFTPQFTFHGFRYVELTGLPSAPAKDAVSGLVFHTDAPFTAKLETGNAMINQLWSNILWGQRSNFVGIPTDCPQRDERLGWMGDAQVFWRTCDYNMDLAAFSRKFGGDMRGTQSGTPYYGIYSPGTAPNRDSSRRDGAMRRVIPWTSWLQTGDTSVIDQNWAAMEKYLNAIDATIRMGFGCMRRDGFRRLAVAGREDGLCAHRDCLLGLRRDADAADGARHRARAGRGEVRAALREDSRCLRKEVCARRWFCGRRGEQHQSPLADQQPRREEQRTATRRPDMCWRCT